MWRRLIVLSIVCIGHTADADIAGVATLQPSSDGNGCLDIIDANRPLVRECDDTAPSQQWKLSAIKEGFYRLTPQGSGDRKCLDIINDGKLNNRVTLVDCGNASGQYWKLTASAAGYLLTTEWRGAKLCLDAVREGSKSRLLLTECANRPSQQWRLSKAAIGGGDGGSSGGGAASADVDHDNIGVDPKSTFEPQFVIMFHPCKLMMRSADNSSRAGRSRTVTVSCRRAASNKKLLCKAVPGNHRAAFDKSRYVFEANVTQDTAAVRKFAASGTLLGSIEVSIDLKSRDSTLRVNQAGTPTECTAGAYGTAEEIKQLNAKYDAEDAASEVGRESSPAREPSQPAKVPSSCKQRGALVIKNPKTECCSGDSKLAKGQRTCL